MTRVTSRAGADGAVSIWLPHAVALGTAADHRGHALHFHKRMWRPVGVTRLILLRKGDLLRRQTFSPKHRRPGHGCMTAVLKLLIDTFMTAAAIAGGHLRGDGKSVMFLALLVWRRLVAIETGDPFLAVTAHFKFVHHGVLLA